MRYTWGDTWESIRGRNSFWTESRRQSKFWGCLQGLELSYQISYNFRPSLFMSEINVQNSGEDNQRCFSNLFREIPNKLFRQRIFLNYIKWRTILWRIFVVDEYSRRKFLKEWRKKQSGKWILTVHWEVQNNDVHYRSIIVPENWKSRNSIINKLHNVPYAQHNGVKKNLDIAKILFYWMGMMGYIRESIECW